METLLADPVNTLIFFSAVVALIFFGRQMWRSRRPAPPPPPPPKPEESFDDDDLDELEEEELPAGMRRGSGWVVENPAALGQIRDQQRHRLLARGLAMRSRGHYDEAARLFRAYLGQESLTPREEAALLLALGNSFFLEGKLEQAAGHYREAEEVARQELESA